MRIKLLENFLVGSVNYPAGSVLDYELNGGLKDALVASGKAEHTDEPAGSPGPKAAIPIRVEDEATLFHPADGLVLDEAGPDELKVTADSDLTPDGRPVRVKSPKDKDK